MTYSSELCICIVRRSDFDNISSSNVDALKTADDGADLASRPSTGLGCASSRSKGWINRVDVDREVDRRVLACEKGLDPLIWCHSAIAATHQRGRGSS
jgi:hypothetical protein